MESEGSYLDRSIRKLFAWADLESKMFSGYAWFILRTQYFVLTVNDKY